MGNIESYDAHQICAVFVIYRMGRIIKFFGGLTSSINNLNFADLLGNSRIL